MIDDLLPPEAPPHEPLTRVRDRLVVWMLRHRLLGHDAIEALLRANRARRDQAVRPLADAGGGGGGAY